MLNVTVTSSAAASNMRDVINGDVMTSCPISCRVFIQPLSVSRSFVVSGVSLVMEPPV